VDEEGAITLIRSAPKATVIAAQYGSVGLLPHYAGVALGKG